MSKVPYIVTAVLVVLAGLFAILNSVWAGFKYFVLVSLLLLALFWGVWFIYKYFTDFKKEQEEKFKFFKAQKVNSTEVTAEYFDKNLPAYKKEFSKKTLKDRVYKWCVILFCFAIAGAFLAGMILM